MRWRDLVPDIDGQRTIVETTVCPVLTLTPEMGALLEWFDGTHELTAQGWHRACLPSEGGYGDQDCKLMEQLDHVLRVRQGIWLATHKRKASW